MNSTLEQRIEGLAKDALEIAARIERDRTHLEFLKIQLRDQIVQAEMNRPGKVLPFSLGIPAFGVLSVTRDGNSGNLRVSFTHPK